MSRAVKFGPVHAHPAYDVSRATSRGVSVGVFVAGSRESAGNQVGSRPHGCAMSRARKPSSASLYRAWLDAQEGIRLNPRS